MYSNIEVEISDENLGNTFYAIGKSVRVMEKAWLSSFPTKKIIYLTELDIIQSLKDTQKIQAGDNQIIVFSKMEVAKEYAKFKSRYDNDTSAAYYQEFPPVIQILTSSEAKIQNISLAVYNSDPAQANLIDINDIISIHNCWYLTGVHGEENEINLNVGPIYLNLQESSKKCVLQ